MGQTSAGLDNYCRWCSNLPHTYIVHYGLCPRVKAIEYYPNGSLKRVAFGAEEAAQRAVRRLKPVLDELAQR